MIKDKSKIKMNLQLIKGSFSRNEALELVTALIDIKIKFHEKKLNNTSNQNTPSKLYHSKRIKELQKDLYEATTHLKQKKTSIKIDGKIQI